MIEIPQEEFEKRIADVIQGKLTRQELMKELVTDSRTLNNKIQELAGNNIELYLAFIQKFPYKSKEREDINFEALVIEMVKTGCYTDVIAKKYGVGERTIRRKIDEVEKINPSLIVLYKEVKKSNKHRGIPVSPEIQEKIEELVLIPVKLSEQNEIREAQLEEIERIFNERTKIMSREKAAQSMGLTNNRIYKLLNELYRIRIEKQYRAPNFRETLKVETNEPQDNRSNISTNKVVDEINKGETRGED